MGIDFHVWSDSQSWFWRIVRPDRRGGAIGATANEAEAMREARGSIEELAMRCSEGSVRSATYESFSNEMIQAEAWNELLLKLDRYLRQVRRYTV